MENKVQINLRLTKEDLKKIDAKAKKESRSRNNLITLALKKYLQGVSMVLLSLGVLTGCGDEPPKEITPTAGVVAPTGCSWGRNCDQDQGLSSQQRYAIYQRIRFLNQSIDSLEMSDPMTEEIEMQIEDMLDEIDALEILLDS